jgi:rhamnosyltransferase
MSQFSKIIAVVVTYHPKLGMLFALLDALEEQVSSVVIVDNGSDKSLPALLQARAKAGEHVIPLNSNRGVAAAQNTGIIWARQQGADYVVLFDQDSGPAPDMIERLHQVAVKKTTEGVPLAAVGPRYLDERHDNPPPFIKVRGLKIERQPCPCPDAVAEVDYLIASGCLMPVAALDQIGGMREELFIDYVDIEWGLRAKHAGLQSFGVCAATMRHDLGDEPIEFLGRKVPLHSPLRHYYHFRNAVWMYRQSWLPLHWKLADGWRLFLKYGFYTLFAKPRLQHLQMMSRGIWHGIRGRMGMLTMDRPKT